MGEATFDHGAQFITTRDPRFVAALEGWRQTGVVEEWCRGFAENADGHPRWRGKPSMNSVAKHLAHGLEVRLEQQVVALHGLRNQWRAETNTGEVYSASAVVLTPPVPQSLALMAAGGFVLPPEIHARLAGIEYERCLAVMAVLEGPSRLPPPGGLAPAEGPIAWIADNQLKGRFGRASRHDPRHARLQPGALGWRPASEWSAAAGSRGGMAGGGHQDFSSSWLALQQTDAGA